MKLPALPADKANHVIYGLVVAMSAAALATATGHQQSAANAALFAAVAAGVAKELFDWLANRRAARSGVVQTHGVEALDVLATSCGGLACWLVMSLGAP